MVLLRMADEISAHFIDCGMVSYSVSLWAVLGTKVLCKVGIIGSTSCGDGNSWLAAVYLSCCNLVSLSSGVSAAVLSRSQVLFHCEVACLSLAV